MKIANTFNSFAFNLSAFFLLFLFLSPSVVVSQATFERTYSGFHESVVYEILVQKDGNLMIGGRFRENPNTQPRHFSLMKTTPDGSPIWVKEYGSGFGEILHGLLPRPGSGYLLTGYTSQPGPSSRNGYFVHVDSSGSVQRYTAIGTNSNIDLNDYVGSDTLEDGKGFILAGAGGFLKDFFITKVDSLGNVIWSKLIGQNPNQDLATCVLNVPGEGYFVGGRSDVVRANGDMLVMKVDTSGNLLWHRIFNSTGLDFVRSIVQIDTFIYAVGPTGMRSSNNGLDVGIIKMTFDGRVIWQRIIGNPNGWDYPWQTKADGQGNLIIAGYGNDLTGTPLRAMMMKVDSSGTLQWARVYGDTTVSTSFLGVAIAPGGGYYAGGQTYPNSGGPGPFNGYLIRVDNNGQTACGTSRPKSVTQVFMNFNQPNIAMRVTNNHVVGQRADSTQIRTLNDSLICSAGCVPLIARLFVSDTLACVGDTVQLIDQTTGSSAHSWQLDGNPYGTTQSVSFFASQAGNYTFDLHTGTGACADSATVRVHVENYPSFRMNRETVCVKDTLRFWNTTAGATNIQWYVDGNAYATTDTAWFVPATPGQITVGLLTNLSHCVQETTVVAAGQPTAKFGFSLTGNQTWTFTDSSASNIANWRWTFGDGNSSSVQNPTHTYAQPGMYTVCLVVTNTGTCSDTSCQAVNVLVGAGQPVPDMDLVRVWPQPARDLLWMEVPVSMMNGRYALYDLQGKQVLAGELLEAAGQASGQQGGKGHQQAGHNNHGTVPASGSSAVVRAAVSLQGLPDGLFILDVSDQHAHFRKKVLVGK